MMRLHLVNGFLGSGKTTAIIAAAKQHMARGERVGVVTNDQGRYLVDTAFAQAQRLPAVQVAGGCFCCHYEDFARVLQQLHENERPEVIYAESVGSCADIIATVVTPLRHLQTQNLQVTSLSGFVDARLLLRRLQGEPLPFSQEVTYIFDQQLAEATLLVANKIDLLPPASRQALAAMISQHFPGKPFLLQNSLDLSDVAVWREQIDQGIAAPPDKGIDMDYAIYGAGEQQLAWLDMALKMEAGPSTQEALTALIKNIAQALRQASIPIGHLKFFFRSGEHHAKYSLTSLDETPAPLTFSPAAPMVEILINIRAQAPVTDLQTLIREALQESLSTYGITGHILAEDAFHPQAPKRPCPQ